MTKTLLITIFLTVFNGIDGVELSPTTTESMVNQELIKCIEEFEQIKKGMKRDDLNKIVNSEGGISNRKNRTYVHKKYKMLKIDIKFDEIAAKGITENNMDTIAEISKPYLQLPISD